MIVFKSLLTDHQVQICGQQFVITKVLFHEWLIRDKCDSVWQHARLIMDKSYADVFWSWQCEQDYPRSCGGLTFSYQSYGNILIATSRFCLVSNSSLKCSTVTFTLIILLRVPWNKHQWESTHITVPTRFYIRNK